MPVFPTSAPITATLVTAGARLRVVASARTDTAVLVEPIDDTNKSHVKVAQRTEVSFAAGELSVTTVKPGDKSGSVAITVELPAGSRLVLNTAWTEVRADGPLGDCRLETTAGLLRLDRVGALRGNLAGSEVEVGYVAGIADLGGSAAGVRLGEVEGAVTYQGASGTVWIGHAHSTVDLGGAGGSFDIDHAEDGVTAKAADCPIRIGRMSRGQAHLMNASGGIEVGVSDGTAASVDADSTKGAVRNSLPTRADDAGYDEKVHVHARTRRGDIVIHPA